MKRGFNWRGRDGWRAIGCALVGIGFGACMPGGSAPGPVPAEPSVVRLSTERLSGEGEAQAAGLLAEAEEALAAERFDEARVAASTVVETFPASRVSVDALLVLSQAEAEAGEVDAATAHAARLARVLPPDDPRQSSAATIRARALSAAGRPSEAVRVLLALSPGLAPGGGAADSLVRAAIVDLDREALGDVLQDAPLGSPLAVPVMLAYAARLRLMGDAEGARRYARAAVTAGAMEGDLEVAEALLEGRALPGQAPGHIAAILPLSGSPALQELARGIRSGIEAAVAVSPLDEGLEVEFIDDRGDPGTVTGLVREAMDRGVVGFIGPLQDDGVWAAASARPTAVPIISPTAYELPADVDAVYSLGSVDPGAPNALARWAVDVGLLQVVVLHPSRGPSAEEARLFEATFQELGGSVLRTLSYEPEATFYQDQMRIVQGLRPQALVLPIPAEDVQAIASQAAFYALDTLGIQLLGTAAWGDPAVRAGVSSRYTDGVMTATPRAQGRDAEGFRAFEAAYESRFSRTLTESGAAPAAGFDAASLLLRALESGAREPGDVIRALEEIDAFTGATGTLSVQEGRIVREHAVLCVQNAGLVELGPGIKPEPVYRPYAPHPTTGVVPEGPGRPAGFRCVASVSER